MNNISDKLIIALDVSTLEEAKYFVDILYPHVKMFKVGSQLFTACGPSAVEMVVRKKAQVFLDLKFYDIPNTVYLSASTGTGLSYPVISETSERFPKIEKDVDMAIKSGVFMMTVHIKGGEEMLRAAVKGAADKAAELKIKPPFVVGVTRLTSDSYEVDMKESVLGAAKTAQDSGLDGVVCAVAEAPIIREELGKDFIIVTPGIRPNDYSADDQKRTATAKEAIEAGANFIVIGRPILKAKDPLKAAKEIISCLTHSTPL